MADYHTVYKDVPGTTTEWDDLQVKYGNRVAKPKPEKVPWEAAPEAGPKDKEWLDAKSAEDLEDLEDEVDDDRFMEEYRRKRLAELQAAARKPRFAGVQQIVGSDFVREVSQAPPDVWVIVHLFKDGIADCQILGQCLEDLSAKYTGTKFVKMISTDCIKDYPDFNLPTLLVYNNAAVKATIVGISRFGGRNCTPEDVAFSLLQVGPVFSGSQTEAGSSKEEIAQKVQRDYIEKLVARREQQDDGDEHD
eukprot:TRINITY_DN20326_c0_g1_i1.p1 TRINITY_DN20326_c0_g1~~TRINITY_DN20326_c0_g1_i1.p1  ORF type:complete len:249 (-),score=61.77 TRINITY_DN20326_c0_g1_i1:510-1256(-)